MFEHCQYTRHSRAPGFSKRALSAVALAVVYVSLCHLQGAPGPIRVSSNGRYFVDAQGEPFYFLADTQWELFRRYSISDAKLILENRKAKGFTVVMVMLTGVGSGTGPNLEGQRPWLNDNPATPNPDYFTNVDAVVKLAQANDIHLLIGIYHQTYGGRVTVENAKAWAAWATRRYRDYPNIIWTLYPKATEAYRPIISELAEGIQEGDGRKHLVSMHPDPSPATSSFMHAEPWLSFNSIQVWNQLSSVYPMTLADYNKLPAKPVIMLEGVYEGGEEYGFPITPLLVRREAYYTCLGGGFHGYGHNDSWRVKPRWRDALDDPGARQMSVLKNVFTALPEWWMLVPDQAVFTSGGNTRGDVLNLGARSANGKWIIAYLAGQSNVTVNMARITAADSASAEWIDPVSGRPELIGRFPTREPQSFTRPAGWHDAVLVLKAVEDIKAADTGETLYNGIVLPRDWPPRLADFPTSVEKEPVTPPYLLSPPRVIPIDVGRQLFVDDFLIAETTLKRTFHLAKYHLANPILKPDQPWEMKNPDHAAAMVFSDGVWYDPKDQLFKMWYLGGESASTGYATSRDGIQWEKPALDVRPPTNIVQPGGRDSSTVWLDLEEKDPARRFKMFRVIGAGEDPVTKWNNWQMAIHFSADGIHWGEPVARSGRVVDRSTVFWNPFRQVWVYSIRHVYQVGDEVDKRYGFARRRSYVEGPDVLAASRWQVNEPLRWTDVDRLDPQRDDLKIKPQLYNLDAVAYESLLVGFFTIWRGQPADRHKPNNVVLGYSRDGWHWLRPDRRAFCPVSDKQGDWNANNVQSAGGGFLVVGDELYFYVSGRTGRPGNNKGGTLTTGLATLRRDGFASMDADETEGTLTTRLVRFSGKYLFVNVDDPTGELRVEILNAAGQVVPRFTTENCTAVTANKALHAVRWNGVDDLSSLTNQPLRFRFHLKKGRLYAFWVSPRRSGASYGYVAAGGPGFSSNRDTDNSAGRLQ